MNRVRGEGGRFNSNLPRGVLQDGECTIRIKQEKSADLDSQQQMLLDVCIHFVQQQPSVCRFHFVNNGN